MVLCGSHHRNEGAPKEHDPVGGIVSWRWGSSSVPFGVLTRESLGAWPAGYVADSLMKKAPRPAAGPVENIWLSIVLIWIGDDDG